MKKSKLISLCLLAGFIFCSVATNAQEGKTKFRYGAIGVYASPYGANAMFCFKSYEGGGSYDNDGSYAFGLSYMYQLSKYFDIETGIDYSIHNTIFLPPYQNIYPDLHSTKHRVEILSIPMTVRVNFWNYFFANGGAILSFDISKKDVWVDNQTGLGAMLGIGAKYDFDFGLSIYVNPYLRTHAIIPFSSAGFHERVWENGVRIGVTYGIGK